MATEGTTNTPAPAKKKKVKKTNEQIKIESNYLRGTILEGLADESTGALAPDDTQLTKFHGIYQQDDRDLRRERRKAKLEPAYSFIRRFIPAISGIDLAPLVALVAVYALRIILINNIPAFY